MRRTGKVKPSSARIGLVVIAILMLHSPPVRCRRPARRGHRRRKRGPARSRADIRAIRRADQLPPHFGCGRSRRPAGSRHSGRRGAGRAPASRFRRRRRDGVHRVRIPRRRGPRRVRRPLPCAAQIPCGIAEQPPSGQATMERDAPPPPDRMRAMYAVIYNVWRKAMGQRIVG